MAVLDRVRMFNKRVLNPFTMRMAGRKYWYASVIEHTGRRSGTEYATPVVAEAVPDGFIIPLPYGVGVDWARMSWSLATRPSGLTAEPAEWDSPRSSPRRTLPHSFATNGDAPLSCSGCEISSV